MGPKQDRIQRKCKFCRKSFGVVRSRVKRGADKFCSRDCWQQSVAAKGIHRVCANCGKSFRTTPYKARKGWGTTCSRECHGRVNRNRVWLTCKTCKQKFELWNGRVGRGRGKYCSKECANKNKRTGRINRDGYVVMKYAGHPLANKSGVVYGHWKTMWDAYNEADWLLAAKKNGATIHHVNGIRDDNRIENLQLRQGKHGRGSSYVCLDCGSHNVGPVPIKE